MNHATAALLHHVAAATNGEGYTRITTGALCAEIPEARALGLVESPNRTRGALDDYWLRLTVRGRNVAEEMLAVGSELIGMT